MNDAIQEGIKREVVDGMGMPLDQWTYRNCVAHFGVGADWATLYDIETEEAHQNEGQAQHLLSVAKHCYEHEGRKFGGTVALSYAMQRIYNKLGIKEYK